MTEHDRIANALRRIASATSVARTRSEDLSRQENHGLLATRLEAVASRFERLADEMEATLSKT